MRLQKYMSQAGICSRREAERYIADGLVQVNGEVAHIGQVIDPVSDTVKYADKLVTAQEKKVYYVYHKPRGIVTSNPSRWEKSIVDIIDTPERVFPIGRLDKETTGLILLTNDGRLSNWLMHPRYGHEKEYLVEVYGKIEDEALEDMRRGGIYMLGKRTRAAGVTRVSTGMFRITLGEGMNRQIRRMVEHVGYDVKRLKRIRIENIELTDLVEGWLRPLSPTELSDLMDRMRPYEPETDITISWEVIHGDGHGRKIGFPTANISYRTRDVNTFIEDATYIVRVDRNGTQHQGAGVYMPHKGVFEVHILDFDEDIYGEHLQVIVLKKLRDNRRFNWDEDLMAQIQQDITHVRDYFQINPWK